MYADETIRVVHTDGTITYQVDGEAHRPDGPAVIYADGSEEWHFRGMIHRFRGPALKYSNGATAWVQYGKLHRDDGPAIINENDLPIMVAGVFQKKGISWWWRGDQHTFESWCKMTNKTPEEVTALVLEWM